LSHSFRKSDFGPVDAMPGFGSNRSSIVFSQWINASLDPLQKGQMGDLSPKASASRELHPSQQQGAEQEITMSAEAATQAIESHQDTNKSFAKRNHPKPIHTCVGENPAISEVQQIEIEKIQQRIVRRRRQKITALYVRLSIFVLIPTCLVTYYFVAIATPLFSAKSELFIEKGESMSKSSMGKTSYGETQSEGRDLYAVQGYLTSPAAMLQLDKNDAFTKAFSGETIDPITRLPVSPSIKKRYDLYKKMVKVSFDPTEGILQLEVRSPNPETSVSWSKTLIAISEQRITDVSSRVRNNIVSDADSALKAASDNRDDVLKRLLLEQARVSTFDPGSEAQSLLAEISDLQNQMNRKKLLLMELQELANPSPDRISSVEGEIRRMTRLVQQIRMRLSSETVGGGSLAEISANIGMLQAELNTRESMLANSIDRVEAARMDADRKSKYLVQGVEPVAMDTPVFPEKIKAPIVAFLIFSGVYLMCSMTLSILKEQ